MHSEHTQISGDELQGLRTAVEVFRVVSVSLDLNQTLNAVLDGLRPLVNYDSAGIYVIDNSGRVRAQVVRGYDDGEHLTDKGREVISRVLDLEGQSLSPNTVINSRCTIARILTRSEIAVPLVGSGGRIVGVLNLQSDRRNEYGEAALELVTLFAAAATAAIEKVTLHAELMEKRGMEHELEVARTVMEGLLPRTAPRLAGFEIAVTYTPSRQVGGDYYDFIPIDNDRWGMVVADVMGEGVPAALLASALRASLHSLARNELALRSVLNKTNHFFRESAQDSMFATLFYAEIDIKARRLIYINAGHPPALLLRADGRRELLASGGPPLGIVDQPRYLEDFATLAQGDVLAVYTDGISETNNSEEQEYGPARLADLQRLALE